VLKNLMEKVFGDKFDILINERPNALPIVTISKRPGEDEKEVSTVLDGLSCCCSLLHSYMFC